MITMADFKQIIQLRNEGVKQDEIAQRLGVSRRSVIRYLNSGKIPVYQRKKKRCRKDPLDGYYDIAEKQLTSNQDLLLDDLFEYLKLLRQYVQNHLFCFFQ